MIVGHRRDRGVKRDGFRDRYFWNDEVASLSVYL